MIRAVFVLVAIVAFASVASASDYACPADPGACFVDVENDGCFDADSDTLGVEVQMVAADFDTIDFGPGAGLVCPPSVKRLDIAGIDVNWRSRGDASFFGTKIHVPKNVDRFAGWDLRFSAAGAARLVDVKITGDAGAAGGFSAGGELYLSGEVHFPLCVECTTRGQFFLITGDGAPLRVGPNTTIEAGAIVIQTNEGDPAEGPAGRMVLDRGVKLRQTDPDEFVYLHAYGLRPFPPVLISASDLSINAKGKIWVSAHGGVVLSGRTRLQAAGLPDDSPGFDFSILFNVTGGPLEISSVTAHAVHSIIINGDPVAALRGGTVAIGPENDVRARRSRLRAVAADALISVNSELSIDFERVTLEASRILLKQKGTHLEFRNGRIQGRGPNANVRIRAPEGASCDLARTTVDKASLSTSCELLPDEMRSRHAIQKRRAQLSGPSGPAESARLPIR